MNKKKSIFLISIIALICSCTLTGQSTSEPESIVNTDTPVPVASSTPLPSATDAPSATPQDTPTALPVLRQVPMTLMINQPKSSFDSVAFLEEFITLIEEEDLQVVTYRDLSDEPALTATHAGKLMVITIDNIFLQIPINKGVMQMIDLLKQAGYPAVLGIITEGDRVDPETLATLVELQDLGWEIASNTDTYRNLLEVQQSAPKTIALEIDTSLDKLMTACGIRPITLILPYGEMIDKDEQIKRTDVEWVVGIYGGESYDTSAAYYYVGRQSPAGTAQQTFELMKQRFTP
ncbi:MAG: polysaccharide deacetylase family protein [Anaerolineaceae bacterium]|nr:polysaccharide deacetylase family protein [Anaerolineaceae bacterium]